MEHKQTHPWHYYPVHFSTDWCKHTGVAIYKTWGRGWHWPRQGIWEWGVLRNPLKNPLKNPVEESRCSQGPHFRLKSSKLTAHKTPFWKMILEISLFILYNLKFCPNFSSQAPKFKIFSSQHLIFQRQKSVLDEMYLRYLCARFVQCATNPTHQKNQLHHATKPCSFKSYPPFCGKWRNYIWRCSAFKRLVTIFLYSWFFKFQPLSYQLAKKKKKSPR